MTEPTLSIVVIGRNEAGDLAACLESVALLCQVEGEVEVLYVDSASTDGSPEVAARFGAQVTVLRSDRPTAAKGRNAGWRNARAPYVLFLDGDTVLHPAFATTAIEAIAKDSQIAAVWGHRREQRPGDSLYNAVLDLDWIYAPGDTDFCGGDVLMRRSALEELGGYDPEMIAGEEPELCRRLRAKNYRILHIDVPMTRHDLKITRFQQYWKRAIRAGHAFAEVSQRFRRTDDPMWVAESRRNLIRGSFWVGSLLMSLGALLISVVPLTLCFTLLALVSARTGWKSRWKAPRRPGLLLLYGFHSQAQQIPILLGQWSYYRGQSSGKRRKLIEYKEESGA